MLVLILMTLIEDKKFHRVMYRPAFAVQARELTTQQSILQNQIELLGDSMYKHGSMVIPGEATFDLKLFLNKINFFHRHISKFQRHNYYRWNIWCYCFCFRVVLLLMVLILIHYLLNIKTLVQITFQLHLLKVKH